MWRSAAVAAIHATVSVNAQLVCKSCLVTVYIQLMQTAKVEGLDRTVSDYVYGLGFVPKHCTMAHQADWTQADTKLSLLY